MSELQSTATPDLVLFNGRFTTLDNITITPKSPQRPPFWVSGRKDAAMKRAARNRRGARLSRPCTISGAMSATTAPSSAP